MNINTRKTVYTALFACVAMGLYALESTVPPLIPIPGVKLGLANIITLITFYSLGKKEALSQLMLRILMTALLFGHMMTLAFSAVGGLLSFAVLCISSKLLDESQLWATGVFCALAHNAGQVIVAMLVTSQAAVAYYMLFLVISSIVTGIFSGVCSRYCIKIIKKFRLV